MKKTLLINIFDSNVAKNILRTGILRILKGRQDLNIVILTPKIRAEKYAEEFCGENMTVLALPDILPSKLEQLVLFAARNSIPTHSLRQVQEVGGDGRRIPGVHYIFARIFWVFGHADIWRRFVAVLGFVFIRHEIFDEILEKYKPDLVFSATDFAVNDVRLIKNAQKRKIKTISMIKSWDNLTTKDPILIHPDYLIVHNEIIKNEAVGIHHVSREKIFISGIPQFDFYVDPDFTHPKEEFLKRLGLDSAKKIIFFAAVGSKVMLYEKETIKLLADIVNSGQLKYPSQLLVRVHPAFADDADGLQDIPNIIIDKPGKVLASTKVALRDGWEFDMDDMKHLASTLKWSDVSINCGSTVTIESCIFGAPVILVNFDVYKEQNYWHAAERILKREHLQSIVKSGGARVARNQDELTDFINMYLEDKNKDREGRKKLVVEQCFSVDGRSGERIANFILSLLP